jgi:hypothetical protein
MTNENENEYYKLLERLKVDNSNDVGIVLNTLNKMSNDQLRALYYFLFPEGSKPDEETSQVVKSLKEKGKEHFKAERKGNEVVIEIL